MTESLHISTAELATLTDARDTCLAIAQRLPYDSRGCEAWQAAERAMFHAMNIARSYYAAAIDDDTMYNRKVEVVA
jgi:hypothetical protein